MKTYLPRADALQQAQGLWCVEAAHMDRIAEAYFLGGDFDGRHDCCFYYMVWPDAEMNIWNVGLNLYGQLDIPFSTSRCVVLGTYRALRDALDAAEAHALKRLMTGKTVVDSRPTVDDGLLKVPLSPKDANPSHNLYS